jgi:hypothetical protein
MKYLILLSLLVPVSAESLRYSINWQSGLSLGEANLGAERSHANDSQSWQFSLDLDASVPGYPLRDQYRSGASPELCAVRFEKDYQHGSRKGKELLTFDQQKNTVTRKTLDGGGESTFNVPPCAREALSYLQFVRSELAQGRVAPPQSIVFGAIYSVRLDLKGTEKIAAGAKPVDADHLVVTIKGPSSDRTIDVYFAKDAARTPLAAKVPTELGVFSVELLR